MQLENSKSRPNDWVATGLKSTLVSQVYQATIIRANKDIDNPVSLHQKQPIAR